MDQEAEVLETTDLKIIDKRPQYPIHAPIESMSPVAIAVSKGYTPEQVKQVMELQERHDANEARKAYAKNMAAFKAAPPEILKTKHVSYKNSKNQMVEWDHAVLGEVCDAIITAMSPHGLYHMWTLDQTDPNVVKTTCILTHELGHSEQVEMSGPPDTSGGKDALKAVSSTNTLLQRLTLLAVTGLAAKGMDNENPGNAEPGEMGAFEQWQIKCDEAGTAAKTVDEIVKWWTDNEEDIKKELGDVGAANIFVLIVDHKDRLKKLAPNTEREPGQEG